MDKQLAKNIIAPIHRDGWMIIAGAVFITLLLAWWSAFFGWIGLIITGWVVYFFRNPERVTPSRDGLVISPSDGIVHKITSTKAPKELELGNETWTRVSIFLNIFDVHVNRIPISGKIVKSFYRHGKFFNASLDKASEHNERQSLAVKTKDGVTIAFVQIAGLIARRIACDVQKNQQVLGGQRYGIIRFGSRVDVFLPKGVNPLVIEGQRMLAGESVIADLTSKESARKGTIR